MCVYRNGGFVSASVSSKSFVARSPSLFWMTHDLSVCVYIWESSYLTEALVLGYSGFYFFLWVIFLKPFCEMIIFRHFTHGYRNSTRRFFAENAVSLLWLPKAVVEDVLNFLPESIASLVSLERRSQFFWSYIHLLGGSAYNHSVPTLTRSELCGGKKKVERHTGTSDALSLTQLS